MIRVKAGGRAIVFHTQPQITAIGIGQADDGL